MDINLFDKLSPEESDSDAAVGHLNEAGQFLSLNASLFINLRVEVPN